jgi:hypothetical protein
MQQGRRQGGFMRFDLLALYGGPDQVMTVTSGLASLLGLLLMFWNKIVGVFFKMVRKIKGPPGPVAAEPARKDAATKTP